MARRRWSFTMSPIEHGFIRRLDDWYRGLLTPAGRAMLWASVAAGILLLGGLVRPLVWCFSFCVASLAGAVVAGVAFRPRLELSRHLPPPPSAGDALSYRVSVRNTGRRPARNVVVQERDLPAEVRPAGELPAIDRLAPGESAEVTVRLACHARGAYTLRRLQAASAFPSGLFKWARRAGGAERLIVYPRFTRLERFDVPHGRNYQPGGIPVVSQIGESTEFTSTREWRQGDRVKDVHWPSFARTGKLIVKEYQEEYFVRLAMVLDVEARDAKEEKRLEEGLSLAAGIADALARQEFIIDLFAAGPQVFHFQAGRAIAHLENILEILACLEPGDRLDHAALEAALVPEAARLSAVIFLLMDWDERRAAIVQELKKHGVAVRVLCLDAQRPPAGLAPEELVVL